MCVCVFQSGLVFLQDLQRDLRVKDQVIQQCVSALRDLLSDRKCVPSPALQVSIFPRDILSLSSPLSASLFFSLPLFNTSAVSVCVCMCV